MTAVTNQKNEAAEKKTTKRASAKTAAPKAEKKAVKEPVKQAEKKTVKEPVKQAEKKAAPRRAAPKKAAEPKAAVHFQFEGKDLVARDILDQAMKAYQESHPETEIKTIELYVVANEGAAYYVVNGEAHDDFKILL